MAKQIEELLVKLNIDGVDKLDNVKSSFRELAKALDGPTASALDRARQSVLDFGNAADRSEQLIRGQLEALKGLRTQAGVSSEVYRTLGDDIKRLKDELGGASAEILDQRTKLLKSAEATKVTSGQVKRYIEDLKKLRSETRANSEAFDLFENDITNLTQKVKTLQQTELSNLGKTTVANTRNALGAAKAGVTETIGLFKRLGEQSKTALGQVARSVEGIAALGAGGALSGLGAKAMGGVAALYGAGAGSLTGLKGTLAGVPLIGEKLSQIVSPEAITRLQEAGTNIQALQGKLAALEQMMSGVSQAFTSLGPAATAGGIAASVGVALIFDQIRKKADETRKELEQTFTAVSDDVQLLIRDLSKLGTALGQLSSARLNELLSAARSRFATAPAGSPLSRAMASQIAGLESLSNQEAAAQAVVLEEYRSRVRGTSQAAQDLGARLSFVRERLKVLDTTTAEGSQEFAQLSNESVQLTRRLNDLANSYRNVADMATQAATAEQNAANARIRGNYFNRAAMRQQEQAFAQLSQRIQSAAQATPLLLPAAGQTAGTIAPGALMGGGARPLTGVVETTFGAPSGRERTAPGVSAAVGQAAAVGFSTQAAEAAARSFDNLGRSADRSRRPLREIFVELNNVKSASNGSINSLDAQIRTWTELRNAVNPLAPAYRSATVELERLNKQRQRLSNDSRRLTGMQMAQGVGAAISGGIFGGPEGLLGGLGGLAFGGVGGAFAGAAAGAQVGMFRQQIAGTADYAASIQKLQIALRGIAGSQDAYNRALSAAGAATRELNIPQEDAIRGMTRLSAAIIGAGGTVNDSAFAFRAMSEAIKATGGGAEQVDGALLALTQVFSKGKVSAEELNQIAERLPGTFTLFAQAAGKSGPELQKALQQGQVGLNDLMKFIELLSKRYGTTALTIAQSSQDAGARLSVAFNEMRLQVGAALQPLGSQFQNAFAEFIVKITPGLVLAAKGISFGITAMYKAISSGFNLIKQLNGLIIGLTKTMVVFGGISAGVFVASNITTFISGVKNLYTAFRALLNIQRALLAVESARAGTQAIIAGLAAGATRGKIVGAIIGGGIGIGAAIGLGKLIEGIVDNVTTKVESSLKGINDSMLTRFPEDDKDATGKKAGDKAAKDAQAAADQQQRLAEAIAQSRIRLEDAVFKHQVELDRRRFELNKELIDAETEARVAALTGVQRDIASNVQQLVKTLGDLRIRELEQMRRVVEARQGAISAQRMEAVTQGGPASALQGIYRQGSIGPTSTGPHFDIKRADRSYFSRTALDQFVEVIVGSTRKALSAGVTVPGGTFNAPRPGRIHGGWDYAFPAGAGLQLKGGAQWVRSRAGTAHGDETAFMTPDGKVYKILHGRFEQGGRLPGGVAAQQRRVARETGDAAVASQALSAEEEQLTLLRETLPKLQSAEISRFIAAQTQQLRDQNQTLQDNNQLQQLRNQLATQLVSPDYIDLQVRIKETQLEQNRVVEQYNNLIKDNPALEGALRQVIEDTNTAYAERLRLLRENYDAQQQFNTSVNAGFQAGASQYIESLGTMNEAVSRLTVQGFQGLENALYELTTTGTTNFAAFAAAIMRDTARMIIQQLVMKSLVRMVGNAFGFSGFANGGVFGATNAEAYAVGTGASIDVAALGGVYGPRGAADSTDTAKRFPGNMQYFAMGGVVTKPTLFRYANGGMDSFGLMGEAGPEAIMPLRRLSSGRLGVEAAGSGGGIVNNVTVNVDAKGSAVQGDSQKGEQLARAVSEAVQQELLKQKRPGGILAQ
jgi:lambda family phage tail tape measure protein